MPSASESPYAIRATDIHLTYRTTMDVNPTLKTSVSRIFGGRREVRTIEALKGVSIDVPRGGVLGVIGHNGAGKSTLLRVLAGILPPTSGKVEVYGEISTLLSLGLGFNRNLSGRENVMLGGLAAGLTRPEIRERFDEIVAFSGLEEFIDFPVRAYSSGMTGRLAFSVSVHMDPDILLVDEALSAGDASFKKKATMKMRELCDKAGSIVLVSHALQSVRELSTECILLDHGNLVAAGEPRPVIKEYQRRINVGEEASTTEDL
ncbi:MAG: ABC transporter ATP-binding protein [Ilumatobacter sp.]|nr:ABC transporter ATP-binding protein [Ilumatobacter sp.]MDJ0768357.1 ABC transporter ATP-binding protein [Ilumatobacter sp.]